MSGIQWKSKLQQITEYYRAISNVRDLNTSFKFINDNIKSPSIISISARPSVGKSLLLDQIGHDFVNNGFRWLSFQLELTSYEIIRRELIYFNIPESKKELYLEKVLNKPIDVVESVSINNLYSIVNAYRNYYPDDKILITVDHLFLIHGCDNGKNLQPIFTEFVKFKKMGMYVIFTSHLKRDIYLPDRCKPAHVNNQIFENDIYMSDNILQYADFSIAMDMPFRRGIPIYGPSKIQIQPNDVLLTVLKNRNGERYVYHYERLNNLTYVYKDTYNDTGVSTAISIAKDSFDYVRPDKDEMEALGEVEDINTEIF